MWSSPISGAFLQVAQGLLVVARPAHDRGSDGCRRGLEPGRVEAAAHAGEQALQQGARRRRDRTAPRSGSTPPKQLSMSRPTNWNSSVLLDCTVGDAKSSRATVLSAPRFVWSLQPVRH